MQIHTSGTSQLLEIALISISMTKRELKHYQFLLTLYNIQFYFRFKIFKSGGKLVLQHQTRTHCKLITKAMMHRYRILPQLPKLSSEIKKKYMA